ncbi:hypothetical protein HPT28_00380 [Streptomyces sp. JJ38]|nr:hypothetical protein [Streptomyces sp. JJ38]
MPHSSEEPQIRPSVPGPRTSAGAARVPQPPRPAVPGPRPGPRPGPPRGAGSRPGPGPSRAARSTSPSSGTATVTPTPVRTARIRLEAATPDTAVATADDTVDTLLDEGRAPADILVLTTGEPHPWAEHELSFGEESYWRQQTEGEDVFYALASAVTRTTSRPVVVVAVNGGTDADVARTLPAALAKAGTDLIVCGDPERLRSLL